MGMKAELHTTQVHLEHMSQPLHMSPKHESTRQMNMGFFIGNEDTNIELRGGTIIRYIDMMGTLSD